MARRANRRTEIAHTDRVRIAGIRRCGRAALLQATALRAAFVVVLATPAAAQLPPGARPTGGTVVGGQASISQGGNTTFINQASQRAAINWQTFNVGSQQTVDFKQPNSQAIALNRVISANPSEIAGRIYANGQIVIVNQSGVVFDRGAQVDTEGLTVSAAGITNQNFMAGHMVFDQAPHPGAKITNAGTITVRQAGLAALVAPQVANSGLIQATLGRVILAGASTYTLDLYGDGLLALNVTGQVTSVQLNGQSVPALVTNQGTILANGGTVMLTASAADGLIRTLVSAGGTIAANSVGGSTGRVLAQGVGGSVEIDGEVDAAGLDAGTKGGQVVADATGDVTVGPHALVNVSGNAGGGLIALGTTAARATGGPHAASTMTAGTTTLAAGALLRADATATGQGGRVTLLSREDTNFSGAISARGGAAGGHGGWVEISAMHGMSFLGSVDAGAPLGGGLILVDPTDLEITNGTPLQGFTKMTPAQVHALTGAVLLSATDTLLLHDAVTANGAATSFELDAGISLILEANLSAPGIPVTLMGGTTGLLLQGGTVTADALTLDSQGVITESGSGAFAATSLTGSAAGAVTLQSAGNTLTTLGAFTSGDRFFLADSQALTVNAAVTAAAGFALIAPTLTVTAAGNAKGSAVLLVADKITLSGGVTATGNGLMAINRLTAGTLEIGGATPTITAADLENIVSGTLALGTINGSQVAPQTTEIDFDANVDFTGKVGTLGLFATGLVTDASGGEKVGHLYGTVGTATLTGADTVATLDHFSTTVGTLQFADSSALTIAGDVTGATGVVISAAGLSQTAGTVAATSGALTLTSSAALAIGGTLDAATVKLSATGGDITESGAVTATSLSGSASGAVTLDSASNSVATLTALAATADAVTFDDAHSLVVTGPVTAGAGVTLAVTGTGNSLGLAADLTGSDVTLTAAGSISQASGVVTANTTTIALASTGGGLSIGGTLDATTSLSLAAGGGAIVETVGGTSGAVTATSLSGSASGSVTLDSAANAFGTLAGFGGTSGALTIEDAASLLITAAINRTGAVDITITGPAHTLGLAANITGSSVTLTAPGAITQTSGVVTATATDIDLHSTAAGIAIGGTLSADAAVSLLADGGDIREKVGGNSGSVTATSLSGVADGVVRLDGTTNSVATLTGLTASSGLLIFDDAADFSVIGSVTATGDVTLASVGALTQSSGTIASSGGDVSVTAGTNLGIGGTVSGATVQLAANGGDLTETVGGSSGSVLATTLQATATGAVTLDSGTNAVGTLGASSVGGNFILVDSAALDVAVALSGTTLALSAPTLTIAAGGGLSANTIELRADKYDLLAAVDATNLVGIGLFTPGGTLAVGGAGNFSGISEITAGTLALGSLDGVAADPHVAELDINATTDFTTIAPVLGLFSTGAIGQTAAFSATHLYGAAGSVNLTQSNAIGTLDNFSASAGSLVLASTGALTVDGNVSGSTGVTLSADGITQTGGTISAASGDVTLASSLGIAFGGLLSAAGGTVALNATGGDVAETAGASHGTITATSVTGSASGNVTLDATTNDFATLSALTATTGAITVDDAANLSVTGAVQADLLVGIAVAGAGNTLGLAGDITGSAVTLSAPGGITQTSGSVTANTGDIGLAASGGGISLGGTLDAAGTITLTAGAGNITEATAAALFATALTGSASGRIALNGTANGFGTLTGLAANGGALSLVDAQALDVTGALSASTSVAVTVTGAGNALTLGADITGTTVSLTVDGDITQPTGGIIATSLSGSAAGAVTLDSATNDFGTLAGFAANSLSIDDTASLIVSGAVTVTNAALIEAVGAGNTLGLQADITAGSVTLNAPGEITQTSGTVRATAGDVDLNSSAAGIAFGGTLSATAGTVSLIAGAGDVTETVGGSTTGVLLASTVTGSATDGSVLLTNVANQVTTLGAFPVLNAFEFADGLAVTVNDVISAGTTLLLESPGITVTATGSLSGTPVILRADAFDLVGGVSSTGLVAIDRLTTGTLALGGAGDSFGGAGLAAITAGTLALGSLDGLSAAAETAELDLNSDTDFTSITQTLGLFATGAIVEPGGISVVHLFGNAGSAALTGTNQIAMLDGFATSAGDFALSDAASLTISQVVTATGSVTIAVTGGANTLTVPVDITGTNVSLSADGGLAQTAGTVQATTGDVSLSSADSTVSFAGTVTALGTVTLAAFGDIDETGTLNAAVLTGSAGGSADLTGTNNVAALGDFTATDFTLLDTPDLAVTGTVDAATTLDITDTGTLTIPGTLIAGSAALTAAAIGESGSIQTGLLTGTTTGTASFAGSNAITALGDFSAAGFSLVDTPDLAVTGTVDGGATVAITDAGTLSVAGSITGSTTSLTGAALSIGGTVTAPTQLTLTATAGAIDESGTIITPLLTGSATGSASLIGSNQIAALGDFTAAGFILNDTLDLAVTGAVDGGATVTITDAGALTVPGSITGSTTSLDAASIGIAGTVAAATQLSLTADTIDETGTIITSLLTGSTTGSASLIGANQIAALGDFSAAGFTLNDTPDLAVTGTVDGGASVTITDAGALTVPGSITGSATSLTGASIGIGGTVSAPTQLALTATAGAIDEAGTIATALLTGSATGSAALIGLNQVAALGDFSAANFALNDTPDLAVTGTVDGGANVTITDAGTLSVPGSITGSTTSLTGAALSLGGAVTASTQLTLTATAGAIDEAGTIVTALLTGSATGSASLVGANQIAALGDFAAAGFTLNDTPNLAVTGTVDGGATVTIADTGALTVPGSITGSTTSLTGASIGIGGTVTAPTQLTLAATAGAIDETGTIITSLLTGSATGSASLIGSNQVAALGDFSAANFALNDIPDLAVTGTVDGGATVAITDAGTLSVAGSITGSTTSLTGAALSLGGTVTAPTQLTLTATAGAIDESGTIITALLTGSATGSASLIGSNQIAALGDFTAAGFILDDTPNLAVTGTIDGGTSVAITDTGALTVPGSITGSTTSLDATSIGIAGTVAAATELTLTAGTIDETGTIITSLLTGSTTGSAALIGSNQIAALGDFSAAGFTLNDTPDLAVTGTVDGGASVTITDAGALTVPGSITGSTTSLTGASIGIGGTVTAPTQLTLTATAGAIDETGTIVTALLTGSATGSAALIGLNQVAALGDFSAAGFTLNDTPDLAVTGTVDGGASVTITDAGALTVPGSIAGTTTSLTGASISIGGTVTAPTQLTLTATAGAINETGRIATALLTGSATGSASLAGSNKIAALGDFSAANFALNDIPDLAVTGTVDGGATVTITDAGTLSVAGSITGSTTSLTGAALSLGGTVTAPTQLTLTATAGAIDESGTIITALLTGSATGSASLIGSNQIAALGDFTAAGFILNDTLDLAVTGAVDGGATVTITDAGALTVPGSITGSTTSLDAAAIGIAGTVTAATHLTLTAGTIDETGTIVAALLTGSATGSASLIGSNQIAALGDFAAAGFTLNDTPDLAVTGTVDGGTSVAITDTGALTVPGSITGSTTSLTAASIGIAGTVTAATQLTLTAGTVDETGTIATALLTGSTTGSASLIGSNQIAALGDFSAAGFTLNDTPDLAVTGTVDGGTSVTITDAGALSVPGSITGSTTSLTGASIGIGGTVTAPTQLALTATAGAIDEDGTIITALLTGSATGSTALIGTNQIAALGNFSAAGFALNDTPNLAVTGTVDGGASVAITDAGALSVSGSIAGTTTSLTGASISIGGTVTAPTQLTLTATAGTINEAGSIATALLTGSATGSASLAGSNKIAALGDFSAAGFALNDTPNLAVTGTVDGGASVTITDAGALSVPGSIAGSTTSLTGASLSLGGTVTAPTKLTLVATAGAIDETGSIVTALLTGSATASAAFTGSNRIADLGNFTAAGFTLDDTPDLAVTGTVNGGATVTITDAGALSVPGSITGSITSLTGATISIGGTVTAPTHLTLAATAGTIDENGTIVTALLTGSATGSASLLGLNQIAALGNFTSAGFSLKDTPNLAVTGTVDGGATVTITDTGALSVPGSITGGTTNLTGASIGIGGTVTAPTRLNLFATAGAINETGFITTALLAGSATGSASIIGSNQIAALGNFSAAGFTLNDTPDLDVTGAVNGGATVSIVDTGTLTLDGSITGGTTSLTGAGISLNGTVTAPQKLILTAGAGGIGEPGSIVTALLTGTSAGTAALTGSNTIANVGDFSAAGFALNDTPDLAVTGTVNGAGSVAVNDTGTLTVIGSVVGDTTSLEAVRMIIAGSITAATQLTTTVGAGGIAETGHITTALLTGTTSGSALFGGTNQIASLGDFSAAGFVLTDTPNLAVIGTVNGGASATITDIGTLTVPGSITAATTALNGAGISINGSVTAATQLTLTAGAGGITEAGSLIAALLTGSSAGSAALTGSNTIANLGNFSAAGFTLNDTPNLAVTGTVNGGASVAINDTGTLSIPGTVIGTTTSLTAAAIGETGTIAAALLTGSTTGAASFTGSNRIAALGNFAAASFTLKDTPDLAVTGTVNGGTSISITDAAALAIPGTLIADTTSLTASSIAESGSIQTGLLIGTTTGAASFSGSNQIANLGNFSAVGLTLNDAPDLAVTGTVNGGTSVAITDAGNLTVNGSVSGATTILEAAAIDIPGTVVAPGSLTLTATSGNIGETGSIQAGLLTGSTNGLASFVGSNQIAQLGDFGSATLVLDDQRDLAITGAVHPGGSNTINQVSINDQGNLSLSGSIDASAVSLIAATFSETGSMTASTLTGTIAGGASFAGTNNIATLQRFDAGTGALLFDDAASLSVVGAVTAAGEVTIAISGTGHTLGIASNITGSSIALVAPSSITQASGLMLATDPAGILTMDAADLVSLAGGVNAATIVIGHEDAPAQVTMNNVNITTGSNVKAGTQKPTFPATDGSAKGFFVHTKNFRQTGTTNVNADGASATVDITITGNGVIAFDPTLGLIGLTTELFLNLDRGTASGHIEVSGLNVSYTLPGSPNLSELTGTVGGVNGQPAAGNAYIIPLPNSNYRLNACAIQSVNCILLSPVIVPVGNPVENIQVDTPRRRRSDDDLVLPNVSEEDF